MPRLKSYVESGLRDRLVMQRTGVLQTEEALRILNERGIRGTTYRVYLESLWANEGEKDTTIEHNGTLREAIEKAEREFMATNERGDVQASVRVEIQIADVTYPVPEGYWREYRQRHP